jgi:hypothetical protein
VIPNLRGFQVDNKLAVQLGSIKWIVDSPGRIKIEPRHDMHKRRMSSLDRARHCRASILTPWFCSTDHSGQSGRESITGDLMSKALWVDVFCNAALLGLGGRVSKTALI